MNYEPLYYNHLKLQELFLYLFSCGILIDLKCNHGRVVITKQIQANAPAETKALFIASTILLDF